MTHGYRDTLAAFLKARPNQWVDGLILATIGGQYAWRSRISDARRELHMQIDNRITRRPDGSKISEYCYRVSALQQPELGL